MQTRTRYTCICQKCGSEFTSFKEDAIHCDRHKYLHSPAYLAKLKNRIKESAEVRKAKNRIHAANWRRKKGMKPLDQIRKEAKIRMRPVTSAIILPVPITKATVVKAQVKSEAKIWLQVDRRTRIGFIDENQMRKWKEKHNFNN